MSKIVSIGELAAPQDNNNLESNPHIKSSSTLNLSPATQNANTSDILWREPSSPTESVMPGSPPQGATLRGIITSEADSGPSTELSKSEINSQINIEKDANALVESTTYLDCAYLMTQVPLSGNKKAEISLQKEQETPPKIVSGEIASQLEAVLEPIPKTTNNDHDPHVNNFQNPGNFYGDSPELNDARGIPASPNAHDRIVSIDDSMQMSPSPLPKTSESGEMDLDAVVLAPTINSPTINSPTINLVTKEAMNEGNIATELIPTANSTSTNQGENIVDLNSSPLDSVYLNVKDSNNRLNVDQKPAAVDESLDIQCLQGNKESLLTTNNSEFSKNQSLEELIETEKMNVYAEFELDSSPIQSSSSDTSSVSSSSEDSSDDDYEMLDPAEQARRLMQEDGGSDDDATGKGSKVTSGPLRTLNEKPDEVVKKPNIIVTEDMKIEELGMVENLIENLVLIKAKTSGEYQVLEFGSVLCLENRTVIGAVAETLGRVQQPYYSVRFTNSAAISEAGISHGIKIFYVAQHSTTVFTEPLKAFKGSDASNLHDEEVGDDEIEFSDDEAEAEYKKKLKLAKQAKRGARQGAADGFSQGMRQGSIRNRRPTEDRAWNHDYPLKIDYDEHSGEDELYTPLTRPTNLHEIIGPREAPLDDLNMHQRVDLGIRGRGRDRGRGRGDRTIWDPNHRRGRGQRGNQRGPAALGRSINGHMNGDQEHNNIDMRQSESNGFPPQSHDSQYSPQNRDFNSAPSTNVSIPTYPSVSPYPMGPPPPASSSFTHLNYVTQPPNQYGQQNPHQPYYSPSFGYLSQIQSPTNYQPLQNQFQPHYSAPQYNHQQAQQQQQQHHHHHHNTYAKHQTQPFPTSNPSAPNIPPGAHINPAFFPTTTQSPFLHHAEPQHIHAQLASLSPGNTRMSPESETAFRAAQDRLNVLRSLSQGPGSPPKQI